jgi:hypothetical protein
MLVERDDDLVDHLAVRTVAAFHVDVGLGVKLAPLGREPFESFAPVDIAQERASLEASGPVGQQVDRRIQPDRDRPVVEHLAGARVDEDLAAGGDHPDLVVDQPGDQPPLAVAKVGFA